MARVESAFEHDLVKDLERMYPGAYVIKNHPNYRQGFPDRLFLFGNFWAAFDTKRDASAPVQPNQEHYISRLNRMSFAMFVYPENKEEFLDEIQRQVNASGATRFLKP